MEYKCLREHCFLIEFAGKGDRDFVLRGGPWIYRGDALLVSQYDEHANASLMNLDFLPVWVRLYDMPLSWMTKEMGETLGKRLGKVRLVDADSNGRAWGDYMRVRVEHPVDKPLTRWLKVRKVAGGDIVHFPVKYERVPRFCFYCGHIGHTERDCELPADKRKVSFGTELRCSPHKKNLYRSWTI